VKETVSDKALRDEWGVRSTPKLLLFTIGSLMRAFDWYRKWWPWMTLNSAIVVILRYFIELGSLCISMVEARSVFLRQKCSPTNIVFGNMWLAVILGGYWEKCVKEMYLTLESTKMQTAQYSRAISATAELLILCHSHSCNVFYYVAS